MIRRILTLKFTHINISFSSNRLLATLGNKFSNTKVSKRKIQSLSIPKVCREITNQTVVTKDFPLRQASSLLYGVTLVYKQQMDYNYKEVRLAKQSMIRNFLKIASNPNELLMLSELQQPDPSGNNITGINNTHPANKVTLLQDDPGFNIQFDIVPDLEEWQNTGRAGISGPNMTTGSSMQAVNTTTLTNANPTVRYDTNDSFNMVFAENSDELFLGSDGLNLSQEARNTTKRVDDDGMMNFDTDFVFGNDGNAIEINPSTPQETHQDVDVAPFSGFELDGQMNDFGLPDFEMTNLFDSVPEEHAPHEETIMVTEQPTRRNKSNRKRLKIDNSIQLSVSELRELNTNYVDARISEITELQLKASVKTPEKLFLDSTNHLPEFMKTAITTMIQSKIEPSIDATVRRKRRRSSSVSSIEQARRDDTTSRSNLADITNNIDFGDDNRPPDFNDVMDFNIQNNDNFDDAMLDITFPEANLQEDQFDNHEKSSMNTFFKNGNYSHNGESLSMTQQIEQVDMELQRFYDDLMERKETSSVGVIVDGSQDIKELNFVDILADDASYNRSMVASNFHKLLHLATKNMIGLDYTRSGHDKSKWSLLSAENIVVYC
ncbi:unnamed protein product [Ambrosiozyma monospora]|uniref:Unnamed protein product n=1 Tax=Ambrosiozyma monospora TaxID=43982 RepID=A0A9W7DGK1_AMBMO|nr:unnamed protein product [Ambrosiozyma monospora]